MALIKGFTEIKHGHGGKVYLLAQRLGLDPAEIVDFSASINPLGPPPEVLAAIREELELLLVHYPEVEAASLSRELAGRLGLGTENLAAANGSTEPIHLLPRMAERMGLARRALIVAPAFSEYRAGLEAARWRFDVFRCRVEDDFRADPDELLAALDNDYGLVFLAQPANPTGVLTDRELILKLADGQAARGNLAVIDEAFVDFCPEHSVLGELNDHPGLVVLRSLTKFYALPGLRLGLTAARAGVITALRAIQYPWSVNALAQRAGLMCLEEDGYAARTREVINRERARMAEGLKALGLKVWSSAVNYQMIRLADNHPPAAEVVDGMAGRAMPIRDCANFAGLSEGYIRLAVRSAEENGRLLAALGQLLKGN